MTHEKVTKALERSDSRTCIEIKSIYELIGQAEATKHRLRWDDDAALVRYEIDELIVKLHGLLGKIAERVLEETLQPEGEEAPFFNPEGKR